MFLFGHHKSIQESVEECKATPSAVLLDVREPDEFSSGHIPGAVNLPLSRLERASSPSYPKTTPLFVYCLHGSRSKRAVSLLKKIGYENAKSIGGIASYKGSLQR